MKRLGAISRTARRALETCWYEIRDIFDSPAGWGVLGAGYAFIVLRVVLG